MMAMCAATLGFSSCIDENLDDCVPVDYTTHHTVHYTVRLNTDIEEQIDTTLTTDEEKEIGALLLEKLNPVFNPTMSDVDLTFFDKSTDAQGNTQSSLYEHDTKQVDASETTIGIDLPSGTYTSIAIANTSQDPLVSITDTTNLSKIGIRQETGETVGSQSAGIYTGRVDINTADSISQYENVLSMANSAVAVIINHKGVDVGSVEGYVRGTATGYSAADGTYTYDNSAPVATNVIETETQTCLYAVCFPTQDPLTVSVFIEIGDEILRVDLTSDHPLQPGELQILKLNISDEGGDVEVEAVTVGVSLTLTWKKGGDHDIDL